MSLRTSCKVWASWGCLGKVAQVTSRCTCRVLMLTPETRRLCSIKTMHNALKCNMHYLKHLAVPFHLSFRIEGPTAADPGNEKLFNKINVTVLLHLAFCVKTMLRSTLPTNHPSNRHIMTSEPLLGGAMMVSEPWHPTLPVRTCRFRAERLNS